jgi:hypothetical protein
MSMETKTNPQPEASSDQSPGLYELLHGNKVNPGAAATALHYLDSPKSFGIFDDWSTVTCPDGTEARILKSPLKAFQYYAKEWTSKFSFVVDVLDKIKVGAQPEVQSKIVKIFENLNYVNGALQEMYKNAYLTFAATPCSLASQKEKQKMDRIVAAISLSLIGLKIMLEGDGADKFEKVNSELMKLIDKLTNMILLQ